MFEIEAVNDIEILTFELDIRFDLNPIDLSIEVYTTEIAYDVVMNKPAEWDQLAGTYLVIPPGASSAIIPADDFSPVLIASGEKRSFYVTMKGPYLDHTVYALQQTGDVQMRGDDMQLLVGSGFTSYKFSGIVDSTLDPQFSGVIHYKKTFDCEDPKASTTVVVFSFIFESNELDSTFVEEISASIDHAVGNLLQSNNAMRKFVNENRLSKRKATVTQLHNFDCTLMTVILDIAKWLKSFVC